MTRKAIGRGALAAATALLIFAQAPSHAAPASDDDAVAESTRAESAGKPLSLDKPNRSRVHKASKARKAKLAALKAGKARSALARRAKAEQAAVQQTKADKAADLPPAVSNAKAEMPAPDARGEAAATTAPATPLEMAASDQMTELGRSLAETPASALPEVPAQFEPPQATAVATVPVEAPRPAVEPARVTASRDGSKDPWAQSSLIGKVFIAFGGMLTLASAARMIIA